MRHKISLDLAGLDELIPGFDRAARLLLEKPPVLKPSLQLMMDIKTAFVEAVANAVKHAREIKRHKRVRTELFRDDKNIGFVVYDHGRGYKFDRVSAKSLTDFKSSGRGVFMMKQLADEIEYKKVGSVNKLIFKRALVGHGGSQLELDLLYELSEAIVKQVSIDEVYKIILDRMTEIFDVERASILIYDDEIKALKVVASRGLSDAVKKDVRVSLGDGVSGYVFQHGQALLMEDVSTNKRGIEKKTQYKTKSFMSAPMICSPLKTGEKPVGVINLTERASGKKFTKADLKLLSTIANQAMACLYIRDLVAANKKAESIGRELNQLREIQTSYLPSEAPKIKGYDIAGLCEMAQSAGGDYFDYFYQAPHLFVVVADVSGHSIMSAMTMVNFRAQLKVSLTHSDDPAKILTGLNRTLFADLSALDQFVTCLLMRLDTKTGELIFANAGHYPPFVTGSVPLPPPASTAIGFLPDEKFTNQKTKLRHDEGLLIFTDGAIEGMDKNGKLYGLNRLRDRFLAQKMHASQSLVTALCHDVQNYRAANSPIDDITLLAIKSHAS